MELRLCSAQNDFNKINAVLAELVDGVKDNIGFISPFFKTLIRFAKGKEEILVNFSIKLARDGAWKFAWKYQASSDKIEAIQKRDKAITLLAKGLINPGIKLRLWVWKILFLVSWGSLIFRPILCPPALNAPLLAASMMPGPPPAITGSPAFASRVPMASARA